MDNVHYHMPYDICDEMSHVTSGTNLAEFAIPDKSSMKLHYYISNLYEAVSQAQC